MENIPEMERGTGSKETSRCGIEFERFIHETEMVREMESEISGSNHFTKNQIGGVFERRSIPSRATTEEDDDDGEREWWKYNDGIFVVD